MTTLRNTYDLIQFSQRMYQQGPRTILALDLAMRRASDGERGVLDLLRLLRHAYVDAGRGFGEDELGPLIDGVAAASLRGFFGKYIDGKEQPDLAEWLDVIGYGCKVGAAVPLESATAAQLGARRDFFSASGNAQDSTPGVQRESRRFRRLCEIDKVDRARLRVRDLSCGSCLDAVRVLSRLVRVSNYATARTSNPS
jgi:hypothetical protein